MGEGDLRSTEMKIQMRPRPATAPPRTGTETHPKPRGLETVKTRTPTAAAETMAPSQS